MMLRVGMVGTGSWARRTHAPALAAHPGVELIGLWGRDSESARMFAAELGVRPFGSFKELVENVDIVDLAVPPTAQVALGVQAAAAGRHLLLEKPLSMDSVDGNVLARAVKENHVVGRIFLARIFDPHRQEWLSGAADESWQSARLDWKSAGLLHGSPAAEGWRAAAGPLFDVGPHIISQLELVLGPVISVASATVNRGGALDASFTHQSGAVSSARIDLYVPLEFTEETISFSSPREVRAWKSEGPMDFVVAFQAMVDDLADAIEGRTPKNPVTSRLSNVTEGARVVRLLEVAMGIADRHNANS